MLNIDNKLWLDNNNQPQTRLFEVKEPFRPPHHQSLLNSQTKNNIYSRYSVVAQDSGGTPLPRTPVLPATPLKRGLSPTPRTPRTARLRTRSDTNLVAIHYNSEVSEVLMVFPSIAEATFISHRKMQKFLKSF